MSHFDQASGQPPPMLTSHAACRNEEIAWGGIVFLWMALYAPHIRTGLDR